MNPPHMGLPQPCPCRNAKHLSLHLNPKCVGGSASGSSFSDRSSVLTSSCVSFVIVSAPAPAALPRWMTQGTATIGLVTHSSCIGWEEKGERELCAEGACWCCMLSRGHVVQSQTTQQTHTRETKGRQLCSKCKGASTNQTNNAQLHAACLQMQSGSHAGLLRTPPYDTVPLPNTAPAATTSSNCGWLR